MKWKSVAAFVSLLMIATGGTLAEPVSGGRWGSSASEQPTPRSWKFVGRVVETFNVEHYTYLKLDIGEETIWAAGPRTEVKVGDTVRLPDGEAMVDFYSRSLDRTFDLIYFCSFLHIEGHAGAAPSGPQPR